MSTNPLKIVHINTAKVEAERDFYNFRMQLWAKMEKRANEAAIKKYGVKKS